MSLQSKEWIGKRIATLSIGLHLCKIHDIYYLVDARKQLVRPNGFDVIVVVFKNDEGLIHEEYFPVDKATGSVRFADLMQTGQVVASNGVKPVKKDAVGNKLWIAIKAIHSLLPTAVMEYGKPKIEYCIYKMLPYFKDAGFPAINAIDLYETKQVHVTVELKIEEQISEKIAPVVITKQVTSPDAKPQF